MRPQLAPLVLALTVLALAPPLEAGEMTVIKYHLGGVMQVLTPGAFTMPLYSPASPAPQNVQQPTGSMVTFKFDSSAGVPIQSGNVTMVTFIQSNGLTLPGLATGYNRLELNGSITGGHLLGKTAAGSGSGTGSNNGFFHCTGSVPACYVFGGTASYLWSYRLGRGDSPYHPFAWTPYNPARPGRAVHFNGVADGTHTPAPVVGSGWIFNSSFGGLQAIRPFCTPNISHQQGYLPCSDGGGVSGTISLVGTEVGRTVITPEPAVLPMLAAALVALLGLACAARSFG